MKLLESWLIKLNLGVLPSEAPLEVPQEAPRVCACPLGALASINATSNLEY